jgi:OOP family OmpA-OmpF porin
MKHSTRKLFGTILIFCLVGLADLASGQTTENNNWQSASGPLRNDSKLCWRNGFWTPATADPACDGALKVEQTIAEKKTEPKPKVLEAPVVQVSKVSLLTDTLFDFDQSKIKPEGILKLDGILAKLKDIKVEVVIIIGHTDNIGTQAYNNKLSLRRAESVKTYLVTHGVDVFNIFIEGKGFSEPVATNKTAIGRSQNRRAVIEVVGVPK